MTRNYKALGILFVTMFGLWGCARGPVSEGSSNANADKIKLLEAKTAKLEEDLKGVLAVKEQLSKQLADAEEARAQMQREVEQLQPVIKERDNLLVLIKAKATERDQLQAQYDGFRRNIKELLGQAEAALPQRRQDDQYGSRQSARKPAGRHQRGREGIDR